MVVAEAVGSGTRVNTADSNSWAVATMAHAKDTNRTSRGAEQPHGDEQHPQGRAPC